MNNTENISRLLEGTLSPDHTTRSQSTQGLTQASTTDHSQYIKSLANILKDSKFNEAIRIASGLALKNSLVSKSAQRQLSDKWINQVSVDVREHVKDMVIGCMCDDGARERVASTAAQCASAIAQIEIPHNMWPSLFPTLLSSTTRHTSGGGESEKRAAIECIGFICEEIKPSLLQSHANDILNAIIGCLRSSEPSLSVRRAAAMALTNSCLFIQANMSDPQEAATIMQCVCEAASQAQDDHLAMLAIHALTAIMQSYYPDMVIFMQQGLAQLAIAAVNAPEREAACMAAIEFWSSVFEIERDLVEAALGGEDRDSSSNPSSSGTYKSLNFSFAAMPHLLPPLLRLLQIQPEEWADEPIAPEEWGPAQAASTCLSLLAECVGSRCLLEDGQLMATYTTNINDASRWQARESAIMSLGCILDGPSHGNDDNDPSSSSLMAMSDIIQACLPQLLQILSDDSVAAVRDSAAWCIGRIIDFFHHLLPSTSPLIAQCCRVLANAVGNDCQRVALNACWSLMSIFIHFGGSGSGEEENVATCPCSSSFSECTRVLVGVSERPASSANGITTLTLNIASLTCLANIVGFSAMDCLVIVEQLFVYALGRLGAMTSTTSNNHTGGNDAASVENEEILGALCTLAATCLKKQQSSQQSKSNQERQEPIDRLMNTIMQLISNDHTSACIEDILGLFSVVVDVSPLPEYGKAMTPFLLHCLCQPQRQEGAKEDGGGGIDARLVGVSAGVIGDCVVASAISLEDGNDLMEALPATLMRLCSDMMATLSSPIAHHHLHATASYQAISAILGTLTDLQTATTQSTILIENGRLLTCITGNLPLSTTGIDPNNWDELDAVAGLRESLLEFYTSILPLLNGNGDRQQTVTPLILQSLKALLAHHLEPQQSSLECRLSLGLLGDLASMQATLPTIRTWMHEEWFRHLFDCAESVHGGDQSTMDTLVWARSIMTKV